MTNKNPVMAARQKKPWFTWSFEANCKQSKRNQGMKNKKPMTVIVQGSAWFTWSFVGESLAKGGLQAVGAIVVYAAVVFYLLSRKSDILDKAITLRAPLLSR